MIIIVDADACPKDVLIICMKMGHQYSIQVWTVASFNHHIELDHHIAVGGDSQETDQKMINLAEKGDVAVTQDWGLTAMLLAKMLDL